MYTNDQGHDPKDPKTGLPVDHDLEVEDDDEELEIEEDEDEWDSADNERQTR
jgi:hypothetical protein